MNQIAANIRRNSLELKSCFKIHLSAISTGRNRPRGVARTGLTLAEFAHALLNTYACTVINFKDGLKGKTE